MIEYANASGVSIAYTVFGDGPENIVFMPGWVSHVEVAFEDPNLAYFLRRLGRLGRVALFDKRGTGLSDPVDHVSPDDKIEDIRAVMDAARFERAVLFGVSEGGSLSLRFAASEPERVAAVVTFAAVVRLVASPDVPYAWSEEFFTAFVDLMVDTWGRPSPDDLALILPSVAHDERYVTWLGRYMRMAASPRMLREHMESLRDLDISTALADVQCRVLVLCRPGEGWVDAEHSRVIARGVKQAQFVEVPGADHWPWVGDSDAVLDEVERFLTGVRPRRRQRPNSFGPSALSKRQREVVRLAVHGLTAAEIAAELSIGERTVETHITEAYRKLGVASRTELIRKFPAI